MALNKDQTERLERIFSYAVNLQQSGRMKSTIYCRRSHVLILNQDRTVLMKFPLRTTERELFQKPVSFYANDYDSNNFQEVDGMVIFKRTHGDFLRQKSCKAPGLKVAEVSDMFDKLWPTITPDWITLPKEFLECLDMDLSHVEFRCENGEFICQQRNIYSGSLTTITRKDAKAKSFLAVTKPKDFKPFGLRTNDFAALFEFSTAVRFSFQSKKVAIFENQEVGNRMPFTGVISRCVYDEIGVEHNGREKS